MSLPSSVGLPQEILQGSLDYSIPPDAKSFSIKVQPSNTSSVSTTFSTGTSATTYWGDMPATSQNIIFDLPCGASPSLFLDNRMTTLNFQMTVSITDAGNQSTGTLYNSYLRGGAYSWFDRMYITSQNGQIIEDVGEFGLVNDTLCALQMSNGVRRGIAVQYGFDPAGGSQGHAISNLASTSTLSNSNIETHSYSIPLASGVIGVLADRFLNVGRTSKLQVVLQTSSIIPITGGVNSAFTAGATIKITLSNFSLSCEYVDIGINALSMLDQTLVDGKAYIHGTTYRTTSASLPASAGSTSLLAGIRASSVKSLFTRFAQNGTANATNGLHGKYNSFNPILNSINFNIGGIKYPQTPINPLLAPSQALRETQMAIGAFNNSTMTSSISPSLYCRLSAGGTAQGATVGGTQAYEWNVGSDIVSAQSQFIFGEDVEVIAKRGLLSGLNATSAPIFIELNTASTPTNTHTVYVIGMLDQVLIHDVKSGDLSCRI